MRRRRQGLSLGTVLVLLLCAAALVGFFAFIRTLGGDSPAAAMRLNELAESVSQAFGTPAGSIRPTTAPAHSGESGSMQVAPEPDGTGEAPFRARDPISLMMTLGGMVRFDSDIMASQSYQEDGLLRAIGDRLLSDLTVLGFDHVVVPEPSRPGDVIIPPAPLRQLKNAGADALLLTGTLGLDAGYEAARNTVGAVRAQGFHALGMGQPEGVRMQINGLNIAWLHVADRISRAGVRAVTEEERAQLLNKSDLATLENQVAQLRQSSDLVIVSVSWDGGTRITPTAEQSTLAHRLAQAGADMVLGYGGRQVQQPEVYQLPDPLGGQRDVLIAYSLGTLLTENRSSRDVLAGALLHVNMLVRPEVHGVQFVDLQYTPTFTRKWTENRSTYFAVLPSFIDPPEGMTRAQRDSLKEADALLQRVFSGTPVTLQR